MSRQTPHHPRPGADTGEGEVPPHRDGTIQLPDGRRLGFAEFGDPAGPPVLYFHGFPSCRLEGGLLPMREVRLIAIDRPGYGLSDPKPGRRVVDWADDVRHFLDAVGLERAALVGMSGGGPYAAACAQAMPDRLVGTALVCPLAPPGLAWEEPGPAALLMEMGRRPNALRLTAQAVRSLMRRGNPLLTALAVRRRLAMAAGDRALFADGLQAKVVEGWTEALRQGVEGPCSDAAAYVADWGFRLEDISGPVQVWHGLADRTVPVAAGRVYAARVPGAVARFLPAEGHFSLVVRNHPAILAEVLGRPVECQAA